MTARRDKDLDTKDLDEKNKRAPHVNPVASGMRTGNPQLDPEAPRKNRKKPPPAASKD